ncbi:hypothetical protein [Streptomyces alkaliphilus]|uniref:hypothetical protein n=1 Tax=Streptomyces alkaliphilus TaxID=1472722 RepID=UPI00117C4AE4|nr:hypothetical protein [Streptomyces alkaliphilus]MQS06731.1 hypothetical protein [Streptomyces alkaliphilus]
MGLFSIFRRDTSGKPGEWYYCLRHARVEEGPDCPAKDRLGPYPDRAGAERALRTARDRDEEWRTDPRWNDDPGNGPAGGPPEPGDTGR